MARRGWCGWRAGALLAVVAVLSGASPASSLDSTDFTGDIEAPQVMSFTLSPASADVSSASATLTVTMRITDDLSGVNDFPQLTWHPPGPEPKTAFGGGLTLTSGTRNDGIWSGRIAVDRYAPPGWYTLQFAVPDRVGNWRSFEPADLAARGWPAGFDISDANPDATPPTVTGVQVSAAAVDVRLGSTSLQVDVSVGDSQSGVAGVVVFLHDPSGGTGGANPPSMTLVSGDGRSGRWTGSTTIPRYTRQGRWTIEVRAHDKLINVRTYQAGDLAAGGLTSGFDVVSDEDVTPPAMASVWFDRAEVNVHDADQPVRVRLHITDDKAGVYDVWGPSGSDTQVYAGDPVTGQSAGTGYIPRVSGDNRDGLYEATITVPKSSATGLRPWSIYATDAVGNYGPVDPSRLPALGALPALLVYNVPLPPSLLDVQPGDGQALVRWDPPTDDRGAAVSGYVVVASPDAVRVDVAADARSTVVTGLSNGVTHTFSVMAVNKAGASDPSRSASATPYVGGGTPSASTTAGSPTMPTPPAAPETAVPAAQAGRASGYWMLGQAGTVYGFGDATHFGNATVKAGVAAVDLEPTPGRDGYWIVDAAGRVSPFGAAPRLGSAPTLPAGETVTSLSATRSGRGYWLFTNRGRVLVFGDAPWLGDIASIRLNGPVLDSVPTPTGRGYYMVASDGGVFTFGDALFAGSMARARLNAPVESLVPDPDGRGYWLVATDGGIFAFDAPFHGSTGALRLNRPITGMVGSATGHGYLMVGEDGGIFSFGDVPFRGSLGATPPAAPIVAAAAV